EHWNLLRYSAPHSYIGKKTVNLKQLAVAGQQQVHSLCRFSDGSGKIPAVPAVTSSFCQPGGRVRWLAVMADLKIQSGFRLAAAVADTRDGIAGAHPVAGGLEQALVMGIQTQETFPVVDDQQQAVAAKIIGKDHPAVMYGDHRFAFRSADHHAAPLHLAGDPRTAEAMHHLAICRPGQAAFAAGEFLIAGGQWHRADGVGYLL